MDRHPNILNAASNLLGICFIIIAGLRLTSVDDRSFADETAWVAAVAFLVAIALSYIAIRKQDGAAWQAIWADRAFMVGVAALTLATVVVGFGMS